MVVEGVEVEGIPVEDVVVCGSVEVTGRDVDAWVDVERELVDPWVDVESGLVADCDVDVERVLDNACDVNVELGLDDNCDVDNLKVDVTSGSFVVVCISFTVDGEDVVVSMLSEEVKLPVFGSKVEFGAKLEADVVN